MFSGLTNQVTNWIGKNKEEEGAKPEGETPPAVAEEEAPTVEATEKKESSPTKAVGSRLEMLGNMKNQMTSWIGGGIASLRKTSEGEAVPSTGEQPLDSPVSEASVKGSVKEKDDEDNSSATGGADSEILISDEEDGNKEEGFATAAVSTKALQGAKNIGNFLYSAVNKAGKTVTEAGAKIKKTVEENSILGEFNKEQEAFIKEKENNGNGTAVPPWSGSLNELQLKEQCIALSSDKKNFLRSPPAGADFQFDYKVSYPVAMATLAEDPNLEKMRFELVPKVISEEKFWRNYFYRVSLICQANELSSMSSLDKQDSLTKGDDDIQTVERNLNANITKVEDESSDNLNVSRKDVYELEEDINKLTTDNNYSADEEREWDKELDEELQSFEVVGGGNNDLQWKSQADDAIDSDDLSDLK